MNVVRSIAVCALITLGTLPGASCFAQVAGSCFLPDAPYPREFRAMWWESWAAQEKMESSRARDLAEPVGGGYAFVYYRNNFGQPLKVIDLALEGVSLSEAIADLGSEAGGRKGASLYKSKLSSSKMQKMTAAGEPVWWKPEPASVEPGGWGEIVLRLRRVPKTASISLTIVTDRGAISARVAAGKSVPSFAGISFSPDLATVYLYPEHPSAGARPAKILLDGKDVTGSCVIASDKALRIAPVVLRLGKPLELMSYHNFAATYADGSAARAGIRAWGRDLLYGMWGAQLYGDDSEQVAKGFLNDYVKHNINICMGMVSGKGSDYYHGKEGWDYCARIGLGRMTDYPSEHGKSELIFLYDEPDAHDYSFSEIPAHQRLGTLGKDLVKWAEVLRRKAPDTPILLNIDNSYKPDNWYMYHQLSDIPCLDPYYQGEIDLVYERRPGNMSVHYKPTYVYAATSISQSSARPKPLHVILCSTRYVDKDGKGGRYPTPEEARIMAYYAVAAGAKGLSWWWFSQDSQCMGTGANDPAAKALWNEIGIIGAEVRTAGPLITASCPVPAKIEASRWLWTRALLCGVDTLAVVVTNDNILSDRVGTVYKPVENARVSLKLPAWLRPRDCFEISEDGVADVKWKASPNGFGLELGTVNLSRMIIVTSDAGLRQRLRNIYESRFAASARELKVNRK